MIDVLGFPVQAVGPVFLGALAVHVAAGLACVVSGAVAGLSPKGGSQHVRYGRVFVFGIGALFMTMAVMVVIRWPHNARLLGIGCVAAAGALVGLLDRRHGQHHDGVHLIAMGASYVALLTGFYVDNGANLPVWDRLPALAYWVLPSLVGGPIMARALRRRHLAEMPQP